MKKIFLSLIIVACFASAAFSQPANCTNPVSITVPFAQNGPGTFCFVTSCLGTSINSYNGTTIQINGVDFSNKYCDGVYNCTYPALMNGMYYVYYISTNQYAHFEINGSACSGGTVTTAPTPVATTAPTGAPGAGQVWINPSSQTVNTGATATIQIHANTGSTALGAFGFTITYPSNMFTLGTITDMTSAGLNLTNNTTTAGTIITAGFNATGITASTDISLISITLTANSTDRKSVV